MRLAGKRAFVTGGRQGIGLGIVNAFLAQGAEVTTCGRSARPDDLPQDVAWFELDVSNATDVTRVRAEVGATDILVNNAGVQVEKTVVDSTDADWDLVMEANARGVFNMCRAFIPYMNAGGSIINMSSIAALLGLSHYLSYSAAKGAIRSMTKSIAMHCLEAKNNIRCNSIHPGSISTPMVHNALEKLAGFKLMEQDDPERVRKEMRIGEPLDIANMVLFLVSDESKHMNGAELVIDQGATIGQPNR